PSGATSRLFFFLLRSSASSASQLVHLPVSARRLPATAVISLRKSASDFSSHARIQRASTSQGHSPMTATITHSPAQVKQAQAAAIAVSGLVDLADGHAFVRTSGYRRGPDDIYVSAAQIRQYG